MIPNCGPAATGSAGERDLYHLLKEQLGDEFTVIHSLPWLSTAARQFTHSPSPGVTGELDFLIIHPELGVLALEVKGGVHRLQGLAFVHVDSGTSTRAVDQVRRGTHGLARWLGMDPALRMPIGYALVFPHSDFRGQPLGPALTDRTVAPAETIVIDRPQLPNLATRVVEVMRYWQHSLKARPPGRARVAALLEALCPAYDGTPSWASRVLWDNKFWLRLTPEQSAVVDDVLAGHRHVITGWPGTGKTLVLIESARRLLAMGQSVLVLTFNTLLASHIRRQIGTHPKLRVSTWHAFCRAASGRPKGERELDRQWMETDCVVDVADAAKHGLLAPADVLLVDEAQSFRVEWLDWLSNWHGDRPLIACCDETQVFAFEGQRASLAALCQALGTPQPFALTVALRSPHAIYRRLRDVVRPLHQLHIPRELEPDTLEEHVVTDLPKTLELILMRLASEGLHQKDIVVLTKYGWLYTDPAENLAHQETLSRFRGLEAPVVIVCDAQSMDDTELFCAFSRATTRCIALYDAEVLGTRGASGQFQSTLLTPENALKVKTARQHAFPGDIILTQFSPRWLATKTVKLGWLEEWGSWLVELDGELSEFWSDYLATQSGQAVFSWYDDALRAVYKRATAQDHLHGSPNPVPHSLQFCERCASITPQRRQPSNAEHEWECDVCTDPARSVARIDATLVDELTTLDALLDTPPTGLCQSERRQLPLYLAAGAALRYAERNPQRQWVGLGHNYSGRQAYRAALAFLYSLINRWPVGKQIEIAVVAVALYDRYRTPADLSLRGWKQDFALAAALAGRRGHLKRLAKGIYVTL